ncbi:transposable element Tc1 transposase [Trichonephila clavipes]|nr:transposable element Tc1 transposase [Trichonephila clavipes]
MEGDVSVRRSSMALNDRTASLVDCYRCINVGFVNSLTSAAPRIACKDESHINLWDHDGRIRVRRYAGKHCLPECIIERLSGLTPEVMIGAAVAQWSKYPIMAAEHMQLLPWPAYSPDMSHIEHVWDLVGRRRACDPKPAASKDELLLRILAIWNSLLQADIQNLFDSMPCCIAALIAARVGYTKY